MMLANPGARGLIVRKAATTLTSTALVTFREKVLPEALQAGLVEWYGGSAQESAQYRYSNGSVIVVGGMDKATKIMSADYDVVFVQEATELTVNDWESLTTRLRNGVISFQQLLADCNPDSPTHFLKQRADAGTVTMLRSRHEDNPMLFDAQAQATEIGRAYIAKLDALTGVRYQRLRLGLWVAAEGAIYDEWDSTAHLIDVMPTGWETWPRWWSVDFGFTHPFVLQRWAEDPDGRLYLYAEIFHTRRLVSDHAKKVMDEVAPGGVWSEPKPQGIICDWDAEGRATFEKDTGLATRKANKQVVNGIQAMQKRIRVQPDGKPRLFILRTACRERDGDLVEAGRPACTYEEIPGYVWNGKGKEEPVKEMDDGCDAARYIVAERDLQARVGVRWL